MKTCFNGSNSGASVEKVRKSRIIIISQLKNCVCNIAASRNTLETREGEKCKAKKEEIILIGKSVCFILFFKFLKSALIYATALISIIFHLQNTQRRERVFHLRHSKWTNTFSNGSVHILQLHKKETYKDKKL